jgi:CheY-like chemotaxis protein
VSSSGINVGPLAGINFSKVSFLVADDKAFFRDMVHTALMRAGAQDVKHASSIETALELMGRYGQQIGCVISDWDMTPVGALELLRLVRCRSMVKTAPRTPVVILTARADAGAVKAAMAMDVNGFAVAPLSFEKRKAAAAPGQQSVGRRGQIGGPEKRAYVHSLGCAAGRDPGARYSRPRRPSPAQNRHRTEIIADRPPAHGRSGTW